MGRRKVEERRRAHIWLSIEDDDWIKEHFGKSIGYSEAIRRIIRTFRRNVEAKAGSVAKPVRPPRVTPTVGAPYARPTSGGDPEPE